MTPVTACVVSSSSSPTQENSVPTDSAALALRDITVRFGGVTALDGVTVEVPDRTVVGIIGPNGAGKTTLFNVACGFVTADAGTLHRSGTAITGVKPHQLAGHGIARTLQGLGLFDHLTVLDNVTLGADRHGTAGFWSSLFARSGADEAALRERAHRVMAQLEILPYAEAYPPSLPYAVRKQVALARALVSDPDVLLLDEPASGLSSDEMEALGDRILAVKETTAVMLVEHHMDLVMRVCDRIVVLNFGEVIATGTPDEVREDPAVIAAYLGESAA
ncbi:ABC transporter ATP-binding protein [Nocardioidaceae bacterium]|nr:ABC transporter ATP-binding protein [Nocardioidaceae bacterium]